MCSPGQGGGVAGAPGGPGPATTAGDAVAPQVPQCHPQWRRVARAFLSPAGAARYHDGAPWSDIVAMDAPPGAARALTGGVLALYPELRLADVAVVVATACSARLGRPTPGRCQTFDTGLGAIDVRGPGWVDARYPVVGVVAELAAAGVGAHHITALFNANVPIERLGPALVAAFPGSVPGGGDESPGPALAPRWRCPLACCQPRTRRPPGRAVRRALNRRAGPSQLSSPPAGPA